MLLGGQIKTEPGQEPLILKGFNAVKAFGVDPVKFLCENLGEVTIKSGDGSSIDIAAKVLLALFPDQTACLVQ